MGKLPLEGVRIIEFGFLIAGPLGPRNLADFGAEVIKVESTKRPDGFRPGGGFSASGTAQLNRLRSFNEFNRNKKDIVVDMKKAEGRELVCRLVKISDAVVENFSYNVLAGWGLDYPRLRGVKPDIIMVDLQGLGQTGPWRQWVTWGPTIMAITGMTHQWSQPDSPEPVGSQTAHPDYVTGAYTTFIIMAALHHRARTGQGQHIDAAQMEGTAALMGPIYLDYLVNQRVPKPLGNRSPYFAPHNCYRCRGEDRWCVIAVRSEGEWRSFCQAIGNPEWTENPRFGDVLSRLRHVEELDRRVEEWTSQHAPQEVMETLQKSGVAAAAVQDGRDLFHDEHLRERGFIVEIDHPDMDRQVRYPGIPVKLSETPGSIRERSPLLGEHNDYVFGELLGLSKGEMERLVEAEVLV